MKLSKISFAVAALVGAGAAFAAAPGPAEIAYSAGASAIQGNLQTALDIICKANGGTFKVSRIVQTGAANNNFASYVCANATVTVANYATATYTNYSAGIPFKEIRLNVDQGSFSAIQQVNNVALAYYNPATDANFTPAPNTIVRLGGALDVQPESFPADTIGALLVPVTLPLGVAQAFGVTVSQPLYVAMYNNQLSAGSATVDKPIPSSCGAGNALTSTGKLECIPTISKGQMATIMANNPFNAANTLGAEFLGGAALNNVELGYARRVDTSGTQASAQNYFLGNVCSAVRLGVVEQGPAGGQVLGTLLRSYGLGSTGNVRTVLNDTTKFSIGVISGENNQTGQTWKWLRVQGAPIGENASPSSAGITNRVPVTNGSYDFFFESVYASGGTQGDAYWGAIKTAINAIVPPLGVGLIEKPALDAGYNKGGNTCQFNSSN